MIAPACAQAPAAAAAPTPCIAPAANPAAAGAAPATPAFGLAPPVAAPAPAPALDGALDGALATLARSGLAAAEARSGDGTTEAANDGTAAALPAAMPPACSDHKDAAGQSLLALLLPTPSLPADTAPAASIAAVANGIAPATVATRGLPMPSLVAAQAMPAPRVIDAPSHAAPPSMPAMPVTDDGPANIAMAGSAQAAAVDAPSALQASPTLQPLLQAQPDTRTPAGVDAANGLAPAPAQPAPSGRDLALQELLGSRLQAQLSRGLQQAVIQLEPYMAGTVQLDVRHEAGVLRIHLSASHDEVARQLSGISEGLRQELAGRQYSEVSVQVGSQRHGDGQQHGRHPQEQEQRAPAQPPGRALGESDEAYSHFAAALRRASPSGA